MNYNINSGELRFFFFSFFSFIAESRYFAFFFIARIAFIYIFRDCVGFFFTHFSITILWPYLGDSFFWLARALILILALILT
jgi:hypothetical protein